MSLSFKIDDYKTARQENKYYNIGKSEGQGGQSVNKERQLV